MYCQPGKPGLGTKGVMCMLLLAGAELEAGGAGMGSSENAMCCGWTAFPLAGLPAGGAAAAVKYSATAAPD